jgi:hypothetical protein
LVRLEVSGSGYSDPRHRDPAKVAQDVVRGYITAAKAREWYGAVIDEHGQVDDDVTRALRARASRTPVRRDARDGRAGRRRDDNDFASSADQE